MDPVCSTTKLLRMKSKHPQVSEHASLKDILLGATDAAAGPDNDSKLVGLEG